MSKLVLLRHGQSEWNLSGRFQGHTDINLTQKGIDEAIAANYLIKNITFDAVFTSTLKRTIDTAILALSEEVYISLGAIAKKELIERDYGDLSGMTHQEAEELYGKEQVNQWRNSYDVPPPNGECLRDVGARVIPFFNSDINPLLKMKKNVLIVSHRNPIRALVQYFDKILDENVDEIIVHTSIPIIYEFGVGWKRIA